ncbi:MAG TPA: hypothetical protein H9717_16750 [Candidatus Eisenbergiella merdipullorum]|uniref:Glycosyl hydrolase family 95 catalytic domain-containing protein n=1 Tax=Candidatus Eisenbergiella merdipullorum TaxID=2838553 RepID=A0A9D2L0K3_9FIRM|nr:hypothetical protein [Candidatus Eisenbergiella merdipullorum]
MDNELLWELCHDYLEGMEVSGIREEWKEIGAMAQEVLDHLPPIRFREDGRICEWREDCRETEKGHRHLPFYIFLRNF